MHHYISISFKLFLLSIIISLIILIIALYYSIVIPYNSQQAIASSLQAIAAIIFGIWGVWLSIVSPESFKNVILQKRISNNTNNNLKELKNKDEELLNFFIPPILISIFILISLTLFIMLSPILKDIVTADLIKLYLKYIGFIFLIFVSILQCLTLFILLFIPFWGISRRNQEISQIENFNDDYKEN
ncbi:hypothetical protein QEJ31_02785 [Pigmentibacter sp. JX0631]|uniref:hypothetical protein n=1 Tax=Pigmentibacter sp. JX0631 TaxID=2976982 RepID=UPI002468B02A|nr:hypothetical protein [Pigmentibacter sp. JX0631]WGL60526.1 hypothetical protein QEJ31_02785 [Pigmentibacter sp. JX0631]